MWIFQPGIREKLSELAWASADDACKTAFILVLEADIDLQDAADLKCGQLDFDTRTLTVQRADGASRAVALSVELAQALGDHGHDQPLLAVLNETDGMDRFVAFAETLLGQAGSSELPYFDADQADDTETGMTRDCFDPWQYLEISSDGAHKPCCRFEKWVKPDIDTISRDEPPFRALREKLISGKLSPTCQTCSIRKKISVQDFKEKLEAKAAEKKAADLHSPWKMNELRIDINEACNLRCSYCPVSMPGYNGQPMSADTLEKVLSLALATPKGVKLHINGHGETTYHPGWVPFCRALVDSGKRPLIITNLAKNYSEEEIELLSHFAVVQVSLDSADERMMQKIRKPARVGKIFEDIARIRVKAIRDKRRPPVMSLSVGIYDPSIWALPEFVDEIISMRMNEVTFWNLVKYEHDKLTRPLCDLSAEDADKAAAILSDIRQRLDDAGIPYVFAGDFEGPDGRDMLAEH